MTTFDKCRWVHKKKLNIHPPARWGHSSAILEGNIYIFGGKLNTEGKKLSEPVYKLNCESYEFERFNINNAPSIRDSHTGVFVKKDMWIWGGFSREKVNNDCYEFKGNYWQQIFQFGDIPQPRESQLSIVIQERWILLLGGCDQDKTFQDAYLLDTTTILWKKINQFEGTLPFRQNASICMINDHIYLFGGTCIDQKYSNHMFTLKLNNHDSPFPHNSPVLTVQLIKYGNKSPCPRSSHAAVAYKNRYMIMMGGQTNCRTGTQTKVQELLNDIWVFDALNNTWQQIRTKNPQVFKGLANFTATLYKDDIVIFGGLKQLNDFISTDQLLVLELVDYQQIAKEKKINTVCSVCRMIYKEIPIKQIQFPNKNHQISKIDLEMVYKLAQLIDHPFEAFSLFIRNAQSTSSSLISMDLLQQQQQQKKYYLKILFNSKRLMTKNDIIKFIFEVKYHELSEGSNNIYLKEYEEKQRLTQSNKVFFNNLRFAGFRLGQTILFFTKINQDEILVALINRNAIYYYIQNHKTHNKSDHNDYEIIKKIISACSIQESQFDLLKNNSDFNTAIYILHLNQINHIFELTQLQSQIVFTFKNKYKNPIQSKLSNYLSYHFLNPLSNPIQLYVQGRQVPWIHLQNHLIKNEAYQKINLPKMPQVNLYQGCTLSNVILYQDNQMVNFLRRFNKFSFITGYISLNKEYILNIFSNKIEIRIVQEALELDLEKELSNWLEVRKLKRNATISINSLEKQAKTIE